MESTGTTNSQGYYDEFDTEMAHCSSRSGANQKYKDLVSNLKVRIGCDKVKYKSTST